MYAKSGFKFKGLLAGIAGVALLLIVLMSAAPAFAQAGTEGADTIESLPRVGDKIAWKDFTGAPTIPPGTVGLWVWVDNTGGQNTLHIRSGSDGSTKKFTGTIRTNDAANFYDLAVVNGTGDDSATQTRYNAFTFSITTTGAGEGVDVNWSGIWLYLDLKVDNSYIPSKIFTGAAAKVTTGAPLGTRAGRDGLLTLPLTELDGPTGFMLQVADGYYLYRDNGNRYHLRVTTTSKNDLVLYTGGILAEDKLFHVVHPFHDDPHDFVRVDANKVHFHFTTKGGQDGLDWTLGGANKPDNMIFTLRMNGNVAAPNIALGSNPFGTVKALTFQLTR